MLLSLFLLAGATDLRQARVVSLTDASFNPLPRLSGGDQIAVRITLMNADGTVNASSGDAALTPRLALGLKGHAALATAAGFTAVATPAGWTCVLDLDSDELAMFLRSAVGM